MAAEHAADNKASIEATFGRAATGTDLYMAHFLGLGGARSFLKTLEANPGQAGAGLFPAAAAANHTIFYDASGQPRSVADIYNRFAAKLDRGAAAGGATGLASTTLEAVESEIIPGNAKASRRQRAGRRPRSTRSTEPPIAWKRSFARRRTMPGSPI